MRLKLLLKLFMALTLTSMTLTSCIEKVNLSEVDKNVTLNPALGLPIGSVHAYMTNLLNFVDSSFINVDENNGLYIFFEQDGLNVDFSLEQFSKGEKLNEKLTLSRIKEVKSAFYTIDACISDFNNKINEINDIIKLGKISYIEPLFKPEGINLPDNIISKIEEINTSIETINKFEGTDINNDPIVKNIVIEIKEEVDKIGELPKFTHVDLPETEFSFVQESEYDFGFNVFEEGIKNIRIDSAKVTDANIDFTIKINGVDFSKGGYLLVRLDFPKLFNDSIQDRFEEFKITENEFTFSEKMSHFMAYFDAINKTNHINLSITFTLVSTGSLIIDRDANFIFDTEINLINFEEIYGHIWQKEEFQSGEVAFDIPSELFNSDLVNNNNILLSNPQIDINFSHNMGIPMNLVINNFYYEKNGERFNLNNSKNDSIILGIEKPSKIGDTANEQFRLDNTNSPIAELIQKYPERIGIQWHVLTPWSPDTTLHYFRNPLQANMDLDITVPFQFDEKTQFTYKDTIAADLSSILSTITDIAQIDTLCLYLDINSALPACASIKLLFLDENFNLIRESKSFEIPSAQVDSLGKVETPTLDNQIISFGNDLVQDIVSTKNIQFAITLKGYNESSKIYIQTTDKIDIDLSAYVKAKINLFSNSEEE